MAQKWRFAADLSSPGLLTQELDKDKCQKKENRKTDLGKHEFLDQPSSNVKLHCVYHCCLYLDTEILD